LPGAAEPSREEDVNEEVFNMSLRKFLKKVGVTSQREIEKAVREALDAGRLRGNETLEVEVSLKLGGVALSERITGKIELT
jgi:ribosomal protein L1